MQTRTHTKGNQGITGREPGPTAGPILLAQAEGFAGVVFGGAVEAVMGELLEKPDAEAAEGDTEPNRDPERNGDEEERVQDEPREAVCRLGVFEREVPDAVVRRLQREEKEKSVRHARENPEKHEPF